jgi:hypothetical protein
MSQFTNLTNWYRPLDGIDYATTRSLTWEIGRKGSGSFLTVPPQFAFNVSIPWYLRWWLDPHNPKFHKAAALHDFALEDGWARTSAAAAFSEALRAAGVNRWIRLAMVSAVIFYRWR